MSGKTFSVNENLKLVSLSGFLLFQPNCNNYDAALKSWHMCHFFSLEVESNVTESGKAKSMNAEY